jgi:hypothetical protein
MLRFGREQTETFFVRELKTEEEEEWVGRELQTGGQSTLRTGFA